MVVLVVGMAFLGFVAFVLLMPLVLSMLRMVGTGVLQLRLRLQPILLRASLRTAFLLRKGIGFFSHFFMARRGCRFVFYCVFILWLLLRLVLRLILRLVLRLVLWRFIVHGLNTFQVPASKSSTRVVAPRCPGRAYRGSSVSLPLGRRHSWRITYRAIPGASHVRDRDVLSRPADTDRRFYQHLAET